MTKHTHVDHQSHNPDHRDWEYDGDGTRIYKQEAGFGTKPPWDGGAAAKEKLLWEWKEEDKSTDWVTDFFRGRGF